jgi:hypothetical protein
MGGTVPLSEEELRLLEQMERALAVIADPLGRPSYQVSEVGHGTIIAAAAPRVQVTRTRSSFSNLWRFE